MSRHLRLVALAAGLAASSFALAAPARLPSMIAYERLKAAESRQFVPLPRHMFPTGLIWGCPPVLPACLTSR